jgi:hypothetical protein
MTHSTLDGTQNTLSMESHVYSLRDFALRGTRHLLELNPPYGRDRVWDDARRRLLIRSILMGLPVGTIFLASTSDSPSLSAPLHVVIDGKQRLEAIHAFLDDQLSVPAEWFDPELVLHGVPVDGWSRPGVRWSGLHLSAHRQLLGSSLRVIHVVDHSEHEHAEIFRLINVGGEDQALPATEQR